MPDSDNDQKQRFARIRRLKKILRPLPRRATIHRYPGLKYFARSARKRPYLWSLHKTRVIRAIYIGCVLSLLPIYGLQVVAAFIFALKFRCNLMITVALQFITNPLTAIPLYFLTFNIGDAFLHPLIDGKLEITAKEIPPDMETGFYENMRDFFNSIVEIFNGIISGNFTEPIIRSVYAATSLVLGGIVLGLVIAVILASIYQYISRNTPIQKLIKK